MTGLDNDDRTLGAFGATLGTAQLGEFANALPPATRLHEFEILSVIGQGGFGIVYLAHDLTLDRKVAIKEYMPSALATRTRAMTVAVHSGQHAETFAAGLRSFVNEARLLARFDHPSLLKVHRFWEAHGTAYMVMPYYEGITLGRMLARLSSPPDEATLKALLAPLLDALELIHAAHCFHRDIAPDNILILPDGRPLLLDFGAARRVIGDMTQALTVILKTGYAPVEQYGDIPDMSQGAWTDLYALGSVVQFAITGRTPPQALTRFMDDRRELLAVVGAGRYSDAFLRAIDQTLAVLPKNRPQSVAELRTSMGNWLSTGAVATIGSRAEPAVAGPASVPPPEPAQRTQALAIHDVRSAAAMQRTPSSPTGPHTDILLNPQATPPPTPRPAAQRNALAVGAALLAVTAGVVGLGWWGLRHHLADPMSATASPPAPMAAPAIPNPTAPAPVPAPEPTPAARQTPAAETSMPVAPQGPVQQAQPEAGTAAPAQAAESIRPPKAATPRAPRSAVPETAPAPHKTGRTLSSGRCADIIQRVSIGEEPSDADKTFLKQECGR
jgi:serine/threonine protein kinase